MQTIMSGEQEEDSRAELRRWLTSYDDFDDANKKTDHQTSAQMASESCRGKLKAARQRPRRCKVVNHFDNFNKAGRCYSSAICNHYHQVSRIIMSATFLPLIVVALFVCLVGCVPASVSATNGVDCFKCSSRNGSNPACEDPFHNLNSTRVTSPILPDPQPNVIYHTPCHAGKKGRDGLFPASACIKLTGIFDTTGETLVVRHCALDSGSLTQDTELARMSHCGKFQFEGDLLRGCVLACPEDACNSALAIMSSLKMPSILMWLSSIFALYLSLL